jgi:hypothetical protein
MNGPRNDERQAEQTIRAWLAGSAPATAPASLRQTLESVTATRPGGGRPRWRAAGRLAGLGAVAAVLVVVALVVASMATNGPAPMAGSSPTPSGTTSPSASPTASPSTAPSTTVSTWNLVTGQLPDLQGEGSPGGPIVFARPGAGFVAFVQRLDENFNPQSSVLTSPDGLVWTTQSTVQGSVDGMAFSGDTAVAVGCSNYGDAGTGTDTLVTWASTDFKTWQRTVLAEGTSSFDCVSGVAAGPAGFLASAMTQTGSDLYWRSRDGVTWQPIAPTGIPSQTIGDLRSMPDGYAIEGFLSDRAATWFSADGITWTQTWAGPDPVGYEYYRLGTVLAAPGGGYVSFGTVDETQRRPVWTSQDGLHWMLSGTAGLPAVDRFFSFAAGPRGYVAAVPGAIDTTTNSFGAPSVWISSDGAGWQQEPLPAAISTMPAQSAWAVSDGAHVAIVCVTDSKIFLLVD